jgi:hypothetical protein
MTISFRNRALLTCFLAELALCGAFAAGMVLWLAQGHPWTPRSFAPLPWESPKPGGALFAAWVAAVTAGATAAFSALIGFSLFRRFRKTASHEILFFGVAIAALSLEGLRPLVLYSSGPGFADVLPAILTRAVLFGRWSGIFGLFGASIYAAGFEYEKTGQSLLAALFLALVLAGNLPLDSASLYGTLIVKTGYAALSLTVEGGICLMAILGYLVAAKQRGSRDFAWMGTGVAMLAVGRAGLYSTAPAVCGLGTALMFLGASIYSGRQFRRGLWG